MATGGLHALLSRRGHEVNVKRVYRLYVEEGLMVRRKRRKRLVRDRAAEQRLTGPNQEWAMDFIVDGLATGRMVRILSVVDAYTRECLALEADTSLGSGRVTRVLERLIERGRPEAVRSDNGPEFTSRDDRLGGGLQGRPGPHDAERPRRELLAMSAWRAGSAERCPVYPVQLARRVQPRASTQLAGLPHPQRLHSSKGEGPWPLSLRQPQPST
jgi:hypothetical protein